MRLWPATPSLAQRLTFWYSASLAAILLAASLFLYQSLTRRLEFEDRNLLEDRMQAVVALLGAGNASSLQQRVELEWPHRLEQFFVRITDAQGRLVTETPGVPAVGPSLLVLERNVAGRHVWVALDLRKEQELLASYLRRIALTLLISFLFSLVLGRWIARRGLAPVAAMAREVGEVKSHDLSRRLSLRVPAELQALASSFNELLDKIERSLTQLSQFSADIAHELRNPLHNIRGEMEVALGKYRDPKDYQEVLSSCLEECDRLKSIVDSLLFLARTESNQTPLLAHTLDLRQEMENLVEFYEASASEAGVRLELAVPEGLRFPANRSLVQSAIGNLLSNGIRYTPAGGRILLTAEDCAREVAVHVSDDGPGIPAEDLPRVFDRLYRADSQRSFTGQPHFGLGLSIVQAILRLHHGRAEIESAAGRGTKVTLYFPKSASV